MFGAENVWNQRGYEGVYRGCAKHEVVSPSLQGVSTREWQESKKRASCWLLVVGCWDWDFGGSTKSGKKISGQELGVNRRIHSNPRYRRAQLDETHRKSTHLLPSANYSLFSPFSPLQGRYFLYREGMKISPVVHLAPTGAHSLGGQKTIILLDWGKGGLFDVWSEICSSIKFL